MYSRCPHCQSQQRVSTHQLRKTRGLLTCKVCRQRFDGLEQLSDQAKTPFQKPGSQSAFLAQAQVTPNLGAWYAAGSAVLFLSLVMQLGYLYRQPILQQPQLRQTLQRVCDALSCRLPEYRNLDEWTVSHSDLQQIDQQHYEFSAALTNQSENWQSSPDLQLTLLNYSGQTIAERSFSPQQYLAGQPAPTSHQTVAIRLELAPPATKVGGFTVKLL